MTAREDQPQLKCWHCNELIVSTPYGVGPNGAIHWACYDKLWPNRIPLVPAENQPQRGTCDSTGGHIPHQQGHACVHWRAEDQPRPTPPQEYPPCNCAATQSANFFCHGDECQYKRAVVARYVAAKGEAQGEAPHAHTEKCIAALPPNGESCICEVETGAHPSQDAHQLIRGIVQASLELACLRHDLCFEDAPPMVIEEVSEIVDDTFSALQGIDCCDENPCKEWTAIMQALAGARSTPSLESDKAFTLRCRCGSDFKPECPDCHELYAETYPSGSTPSPDPAPQESAKDGV